MHVASTQTIIYTVNQLGLSSDVTNLEKVMEVLVVNMVLLRPLTTSMWSPRVLRLTIIFELRTRFLTLCQMYLKKNRKAKHM